MDKQPLFPLIHSWAPYLVGIFLIFLAIQIVRAIIERRKWNKKEKEDRNLTSIQLDQKAKQTPGMMSLFFRQEAKRQAEKEEKEN